MALLCFMKAMETDPRCDTALHRSTQLYRLLGNAAAEVEALRLLNAVCACVCVCVCVSCVVCRVDSAVGV